MQGCRWWAACCLALSARPARAWTADGFPDCSTVHGPSCFPNRRAPHHNSLLNSLFNKWCSDKGTYWLSKHNYGAAYDTVLRPIRFRTRNLLELGVGDETAGSLNAWREYFRLLAHGGSAWPEKAHWLKAVPRWISIMRKTPATQQRRLNPVLH